MPNPRAPFAFNSSLSCALSPPRSGGSGSGDGSSSEPEIVDEDGITAEGISSKPKKKRKKEEFEGGLDEGKTVAQVQSWWA